MAYSNTNRDKQQPGRGFDIKKVALVAGLLIVIFSSVFKILEKYTILKKAREKNLSLETKLNRTIDENKILKLQIEEATTSGYKDRKSREFLGMGTKDDVWLVLPKDEANINFEEEMVAEEVKPIIVQWWELFTK